MDNFINTLQSFAEREAKDIRRREQVDERERLRYEKEDLDRNYAAEVAKRQAIASRKTTLDIAWAAAGLLEQEGVTPFSWIRTYEHKEHVGGFFRSRTDVTERSELVLEGWPLLVWQDARYYERRPTHTLVLTTSTQGEDTKAVNLAHFSHKQFGPSYDYHSLSIPTKMTTEDIRPLQAVPLSDDDMLWPRGWRTPRVSSNRAYYAPVELDDYNAVRPLTEPFYSPAPDHAAYNKLHIEDHIRRAIARTVAQRLILDPKNDSKAIELHKALAIED